MTWHLDDATIAAYRARRVTDAVAASLEAHVVSCAQCRGLLTASADGPRLERNLAAITESIDAPQPMLFERLLVGLGVSDHHARLVAMTPALRMGSLSALLLVSALGFLANDTQGAAGELWFLVLAPVVPVLGVALSFGPPLDPAHELLLASPVGALELVLLRATAVLATSIPVTLVVSVVSPGSDWPAAAWLLPALALTAATLALARWMPLRSVAGVLSGGWLATAVLATRGSRAAQLVHEFPAFRPAGQLAFLAVLLIAAASVVATRNSFDLRRIS